MKHLLKYFQNLKLFDKKPEYSLEVVGDKVKRNDLAYFWDNNASELQLLTAVKLMEFTRDTSFTKEELDAYKLGLSEIPLFLELCSQEYKKSLAQPQK